MCTCGDTNTEMARDALLVALARTKQRDAALFLEKRSSERSIVSRISQYMGNLLDCAHDDDAAHLRVDIEYNRILTAIKEPPPEFNGDSMLVDLCVHIRRSHERNILVAEVKPPPSNPRQVALYERDIAKLRWTTSQDGPYKYALGALVNLAGTISWFSNAEQVGESNFEPLLEL